MNSAIVVAAGIGKRFGSDTPKQFLEIGGKPILIHTLEKFENCRAVDEIILVLAAPEIEKFQKIIEKYHLKKLAKIVAGGETRAASVFRGLRAIDEKTAEIVAVHDGARPFVAVDEIEKTIHAANKNGAACLVARVTDTIKKVADGKIVATIDRADLRRALTPQAFRFEILQRAFAAADLSEAATDECFLIEKLGLSIDLVEGGTGNFKITTPEDLVFAEILLQKPE